MPTWIALILISAFISLFTGAAPAGTSTPESLLARADELSGQGNYDQAIEMAQKALASAERAFGASDVRLVKSLKTLAQLYELKGLNAKAEAQYRRALAILERVSRGGNEEADEIKAHLALLAAKKSSETQPGSPQGAQRTPGIQTRSIRKSDAAPPPLTSAPPPSPAAAARRGVVAPGNAATGTVPFFPWPPPASSARYVFPQYAFHRYITVGQVASAILSALESSGYVERSFFQTRPGGVALVTRLERIAGDGRPAPEDERWPSGFDNNPASFIDFVRGLFYAKAGHYRVIVFILQEESFASSEQTATGKDAETWLAEGANKLPAWLANRPFGKDSTCTALIYEFESDGASVKSVVSHLNGKQHLEKAGLLAALAVRN